MVVELWRFVATYFFAWSGSTSSTSRRSGLNYTALAGGRGGVERDRRRRRCHGVLPAEGDVRDGGLVDDLYDGGRHSWLTFLIYLTDDFEGGETEFAPQHRRGGVSVAPRRGSVLCFPHGYHPLSPLHRGAIVSRGVKYVARTDVLYAMPPP